MKIQTPLKSKTAAQIRRERKEQAEKLASGQADENGVKVEPTPVVEPTPEPTPVVDDAKPDWKAVRKHHAKQAKKGVEALTEIRRNELLAMNVPALHELLKRTPGARRQAQKALTVESILQAELNPPAEDKRRGGRSKDARGAAEARVAKAVARVARLTDELAKAEAELTEARVALAGVAKPLVFEVNKLEGDDATTILATEDWFKAVNTFRKLAKSKVGSITIESRDPKTPAQRRLHAQAVQGKVITAPKAPQA